MKPSPRNKFPLALLCSWLAGGSLIAQDADAGADALSSGPPAGAKLTAAPCYASSGRLAGQEFDAAENLGSGPGALLFVHELSRNNAPVIVPITADVAAGSVSHLTIRIRSLTANESST